MTRHSCRVSRTRAGGQACWWPATIAPFRVDPAVVTAVSSQAVTGELSGVNWCLRVGVMLEGIGVYGRYVLSSGESESPIFGVLYFESGWPEALSQTIDDWGTTACCVAGIVAFLAGLLSQVVTRREGSSRRPGILRVIEGVAALTVGLWLLGLAVAQMLRGGAFAELSLGEHAVRYTLAFVLAVWCFLGSEAHVRLRNGLATWLLAIASAATFIVHGYKALLCYGPFTDLILLSDARCAGLAVSQGATEMALVVIGVVDILVAVVLVASRWRYAALYMAGWGLLTAASRMTAFGWHAWPEMLIRAANWAAPLALFLMCCQLLRSRVVLAEPVSEADPE